MILKKINNLRIMQRNLVLIILLAAICNFSVAQSQVLRTKIGEIAKSIKAETGIAVKNFDNNDTLTFNADKHLVMQSVFKLPLVMYTLHLIDSGVLRSDQKVLIRPEDYFDTWSPIMQKYPNANVELTIEELMIETLTLSDNVGCDILFRLVGGPFIVNNYFHSIGITDIEIVYNERDMHVDWKNQFANWSTPLAMVQILERVYHADLLSKSSHDFIWKSMVDCPLGKMRLRGLLPPETEIAHRTGTGGANDQKVIGAVNDVGIVKLPNGDHVAIVAMISNASEEQAALESAIAQVAKVVYDYYSK